MTKNMIDYKAGPKRWREYTRKLLIEAVKQVFDNEGRWIEDATYNIFANIFFDKVLYRMNDVYKKDDELCNLLDKLQSLELYDEWKEDPIRIEARKVVKDEMKKLLANEPMPFLDEKVTTATYFKRHPENRWRPDMTQQK